MAEQVWNKKGLPKPNKNITALYARHLSKAVVEGYGQPIGEIDYDTPDGNMLKHLLENVYAFSAAKNYTQLRQLTQALIGEDGKLRTRSQFKKAAFEINDAHVNHWLEAEYDTAVSGAQMASKWVDITNNPATKFLEFDVVMDSRTSDICKPLHGLIVSIDDPILNVYYPPNHFRCRTTVRQKNSGPATPSHNRTLPEIPDMFRVNVAKQKVIFPPGHSYWVGTPAEVIREAISMAPINSWVWAENKTIRIHSKVNTESTDFTSVIEVARDFAAKGQMVDVLPALSHPDDPLFDVLFKGAKQGKCPDLKINKKLFVEVKAVSKVKINTIKHAIGEASQQANHVVILLNEKVEYIWLKRVAKGRFIDHKNLEVIEFKMEESYYRFHKKNLLK